MPDPQISREKKDPRVERELKEYREKLAGRFGEFEQLVQEYRQFLETTFNAEMRRIYAERGDLKKIVENFDPNVVGMLSVAKPDLMKKVMKKDEFAKLDKEQANLMKLLDEKVAEFKTFSDIFPDPFQALSHWHVLSNADQPEA